MKDVPTFYFLLRLEFLGFRYHGWQVQPGQRTVAGMLLKTFGFILPGVPVKLLGAGRTDARVSARDFALQVIVQSETQPAPGKLLELLNANLPPDIRARSLDTVPPDFNPIRDCISKTYQYIFCWGDRPHPYLASLAGFFPGELDIEHMESVAGAFCGKHNFRCFTASPTPGKQYVRELTGSRILKESQLPDLDIRTRVRVLEVSGKGFGRNQVRLMMAALAAVGAGRADVAEIRKALRTGSGWTGTEIAPASGLHLVRTEFREIA